MKYLVPILICLIFACKSKKEATATAEPSIEDRKEVIQEEVPVEKLNEAPKQTEGANAIALKQFPKNAIGRIQRTACFGRCPIYTLTIYEDGTVIYLGQKWVEKEGTYQTKIDLEVFQKLLDKANEIGYFELDDVYDSDQITDLPSTITTLRQDENLKMVVNRYQGPDKLKGFEQYFDSLFEDVNWTKQE